MGSQSILAKRFPVYRKTTTDKQKGLHSNMSKSQGQRPWECSCNAGVTWELPWQRKGSGHREAANIYIFRSAHNEERHLRSQWLELEGKLLSLFPWLQHAWCSSIHGRTPYLQKVPVKLAAVLQHSAETGTGEVCEQAGKKMDEFGKLLPHGKVIKQQSDGYLKQVNGYSWFKVRERS